MSKLSVRLHLDVLANPTIGFRQAGQLVGASPVSSIRELLAYYRTPAVLWRGFRHVWQYNHRLNRFGSYVKDLEWDAPGSATAVLGHAGASGSGPDTLHYRDLYTAVRATGVFFRSGTEPLTIAGSEGEDTEIQHRVDVPLDGPLKRCDTFVVVLAGIDMCAKRDADKLQSLILGVTDWEKSGDNLSFTITGTLNVDCDSLECDGMPSTWDVVSAVLTGGSSIPVSVGRLLFAKLNLSTEYTAEVHYLVVGGTPRTLNVVAADNETDDNWVEKSYEWDTREEVRLQQQGTRSVQFENVWPTDSCTSTLAFGVMATVIKGERHMLSESEPHMLEWTMAVPEIRADEDEVQGDVVLFFKNWRQGMRNSHPPESLLSFKAPGEGHFGAGITLLQFREATHYREDEVRGRIEWRAARHDSSCIPAAVDEETVHVP